MQSSRFFRKPDDPDSHRLNNIKDNISGIYKDVCKKIVMHDQATSQFKQKQEQYFLKTFSVIMEQMSEELKIAQAKYRDIDLQIQKDEEVKRLQKQLYFFREECVALKEQMSKLTEENARLSGLAGQLREEKSEQYMLLVKRTKEKKALINKIDRNASDEKPPISLRESAYSKNYAQQVLAPGLSRTTRNLQSRNTNSFGKQLTTRPLSDVDCSTPRQFQSREKKYPNRADSELLEIWKSCLKHVRGNNENMKYLAKQTKLKTLGTFFSIDRLLEFLTCKMFGAKCCENPKCKGNFTEPVQNFDLMRTKARPLTVTKTARRASDVEGSKQLYAPYPFRKARQNEPLFLQTGFSLTLGEHK